MADKFISDNSKLRSLSVQEWHEFALEGAYTSVTLKLAGCSMQPLIRKNRDSVTVVPVFRELRRGDIVLFARADGSFVVHRVRRISGSTVQTVGDACVIPDGQLAAADVWGIAVRLERNGRTFNLDSGFSRGLGRLWMLTLPVRRLYINMLRFAARTLKRLKGRR